VLQAASKKIQIIWLLIAPFLIMILISTSIHQPQFLPFLFVIGGLQCPIAYTFH